MRATAGKADDSISNVRNSKLEEKLEGLQKSMADQQRSMESFKRQGKPIFNNENSRRRPPSQQEKSKCYLCESEDYLKPNCPLNDKKGQKPASAEDKSTRPKTLQVRVQDCTWTVKLTIFKQNV